MPPSTSYELACGMRPVCGVDEAGRGPWAGPVVASAVIFHDLGAVPDGVNDSKKISAKKRDALLAAIHAHAHVGVGVASAGEIDRLNILRATMLAMQRAVEALPVRPAFALIDGNRTPQLAMPAQALVGGDALCASIAAASIVAKVTRDRMMAELAAQYPQYGFEKHAGYGTAQHQQALAAHGPCPAHRRSFAPIRTLLEAA